MSRLRLTVVVALSFALISSPVTGQTASFLPLGNLPGSGHALPSGVSADGSVVVGSSLLGSRSNLRWQAFRWTAEDGMVGMAEVLGGADSSVARAVSADGRVIVGETDGETYGGPYLWTAEGGMVGLGNSLDGGVATGVSADGSVVVGHGLPWSGSGFERAFRWTESGGMEMLEHPPGDSLFNHGTFAQAVSADGSTVVGVGSTAPWIYEAFRWTEETGIMALGTLPGHTSSYAYGVSADGSVVVGGGWSEAGSEAFRWTEHGGMVGLGRIADRPSEAYAVSDDGSVIVGDAGAIAFIWTEDTGMLSLLDWLIINGATGLEGWELSAAAAISGDGRWVVGYGTNPFGGGEAFLVNVTRIPLPPSALLLLTALGFFGRRMRCRAAVNGQNN